MRKKHEGPTKASCQAGAAPLRSNEPERVFPQVSFLDLEEKIK